MRKLQLTFLLLLLVYGCTHNISKNNVPQERLTTVHPIVYDHEFIVRNIFDTVWINYHQDYIHYQLALRHLMFDSLENLNEKVTYPTNFIFKKGWAYGYLFDSISNGDEIKKLRVDSILFNRGYKMNIDTVTGLLEIQQQRLKNFAIRKFINKYRSSELDYDSIILYYRKFPKWLNYSFSSKYDRFRNMKLYAINIVFNKKYLSMYDTIVPQRVFKYEIQSSPKVNSELIKQTTNYYLHKLEEQKYL